nr:hypothetical protein [Tanacetum cinerariifolium]
MRDADEENQETAKYEEQDDAEGGGNDEEEDESDEEDDNEETREEESFNPTPKTPEGSEDEGDAEEDQGMESIFVTASSSMAPLHTSIPIMTPSTIATITTISQAPTPPTLIPSEVLQNLPSFDSVFRFDERLKSLEANFSECR